MFRNYFKTAWRHLLKNKFYSLITIAGLTAGLSVGILILMWVQDELSFDGFHKKAGNIYKLENMAGTGSSRQIWTVTAAPIGSLAKQELPEVKDAVRVLYNGYYGQFKYGDKVFTEENRRFVDSSFFSVFDFDLIKGNRSKPFPDDQSVILTATVAQRFFGNEDPVGKVIIADDNTPFTVSGVIKDFPKNSAFRNYDMLFPMTLAGKKMYQGNTQGLHLDNDFHQYNYNTYLLLKEGVDLNALATKLRNIHLRIKAEDTDVGYLFLPLTKMHLYRSDGSEAGMETVRMFMIVAILILIIACINYVNLATARSMLRSKEVSLRKIVGAARNQLFLQFIVETAMLFLLAAVLAIFCISLLMPVFNALSGKELVFNLFDYHIWLILALTITGTLIVSSIYPALLLSSFEPLKALKGKIAARINDVFFRKALVITQFAFSVMLIAGTFTIGRQLHFIRSKQLGYDKEHVFTFPMREMIKHYDAVKANLMKQPGVLAVTRSNNDNLLDIGNQTGNNDWDGKGANETFMLHPMSVDRDFIPFFKMKMAAGNNFTGAIADSSHVILNETAIREAGIKDPIGKRFRIWENNATIIGVVKDFHFETMKKKIEPAVFYFNPANNARIYVRTRGQDAAKAIAAAATEWKRYNASYPFKYDFMDDMFNNLYQSEQRTGTLFNVFAAIAILISSLGLLGLTAYTAQVRTREIGVRKVLGASVGGIIQLMARDFIKLVLLSIVIAIPVAWYAMNKWLEDFAYKINLGWTVFLWSGIVVILIAAITISFQSVKAALANPVKSLRSE